MNARMLHLTMWYAGHNSFDSWWASTRREYGYVAEGLARLDAHRAVELAAMCSGATSHGRSRRDGTRP